MVDLYRSDEARRRREDLAASWSREPPEPASGRDDTLALFFMCCHPSLPPASAVALTLRALGGLTTREIADRLLGPRGDHGTAHQPGQAHAWPTSGEPFTLPAARATTQRLAWCYAWSTSIFNEGYASSGGPDLDRTDLATEAIRLGRLLHELLPDEPEVAGLLALMLLTEARRPARTTGTARSSPWPSRTARAGTAASSRRAPLWPRPRSEHRPMGEYTAQAAVAALHDAALTLRGHRLGPDPRRSTTCWNG